MARRRNREPELWVPLSGIDKKEFNKRFQDLKIKLESNPKITNDEILEFLDIIKKYIQELESESILFNLLRKYNEVKVKVFLGKEYQSAFYRLKNKFSQDFNRNEFLVVSNDLILKEHKKKKTSDGKPFTWLETTFKKNPLLQYK